MIDEKWLFRAWLATVLVCALAGAMAFGAFLTGEAYRGTPLLSPNQSAFVLGVSNFPSVLRRAVREARGRFRSEPTTLLIDRATVERPAWIRRFPSSEDPGYLLFAGLDAAARRTLVRLIRIADGAEMGRWAPNWESVYAKSSPKRWGSKFASTELLPLHPLLLDDGSVIFNTGNAVVRSAACQAEPMWVLDHIGHHSVERGLDDSVWIPSVADTGYSDNARLRDALRMDSLARISFDGRLLENRSVADILEANGLRALLLGLSSLTLQSDDPFHLNQISVAQSDGRQWERGDLLLSSRHLSTVFLYRPSTGRILWYRTGPWMNQHAARFMDDHRISVFDNYSIRTGSNGGDFVMSADTNRVLVYDFDTDGVTEPFASLLKAAQPRTTSEGLARILPDGGLFLEETNQRRLLRFTPERLLWSFVNDYDPTRIGALSWSRYFTPQEVAEPLRALAAACAARPAN